jgi:hypothetical protein
MRKINDRCAALDSNAKRCRREATRSERFSGDSEMRGWPHEDHPSWVLVRLCTKHWEGPWRSKGSRNRFARKP